MKKFTLLNILLVSLSVFAGDKKIFLQHLEWGIDQTRVQLSEAGKNAILANNRQLQYQEKVAGLDFTVGYEFKAGKLERVFYGLNDKSKDTDEYYANYRALKDDLIIRYGMPVTDKEKWNNTLHQNGSQSLALALGHVEFNTVWTTPDSKIWLFCGQDNGNLKTVIVYDSRSL